MPRYLLALLVVLGIGAFAAPASAHVHGAGQGAATVFSPAPTIAPPAAAITAALRAAAALVDETCDRDCGHSPAMGDCLCMAACAAMALPDLPSLVPHPVRAARSAGDAPPWRAMTHGPPTPPPRPL